MPSGKRSGILSESIGSGRAEKWCAAPGAEKNTHVRWTARLELSKPWNEKTRKHTRAGLMRLRGGGWVLSPPVDAVYPTVCVFVRCVVIGP